MAGPWGVMLGQGLLLGSSTQRLAADLCLSQDLAVLDDLEAEVAPGGDLQLSGRGLADLAGIEGSSGADVQQLLEHTAQSVARYATLGSIAGGGDRAAAAQRRHRRQEGPGWLELLEALQQQTVLVRRCAVLCPARCCFACCSAAPLPPALLNLTR